MVQKQSDFCFFVMRFIVWLKAEGYQVTFGEAWRSIETCEAYVKEGKGIKESLHPERLAIDLNLFWNGKFLTTFSDYEKCGEYWESLSTPEYKCCWGGRFKRVDADHFSFEHNGVR